MTNPSSVFISRLQGLQVMDAAGDQVGKVRDVVVQARLAGRPRVRGLVVELFARRRIFVPMTRVHAINPTQVSIVGVIDTRRFIRRASEILVMDDLFDRTITLEAKPSQIFDVAMIEVRNREWELSEVALREVTTTRRFGLPTTAKGPMTIEPWSLVASQVMNAEQTTDTKLAQLADMKPADVARELYDMDPERRAEIASALDDEQLADAFQELPENEQVELLQSLTIERAADVLDEMDPDDAADLINDLPDDMAEELLDRMEPEEAADVRSLLKYEDLTAGGMMTPEPVVLGADNTVAEALARVRNEELTPALASMVFITRQPHDTPSGRYLGAVHVQRLLREPPSLQIGQMIDSVLEPLVTSADISQVSRYFATYNLVVAPVINKDHQLVGAVTVDDLLDHMLPPDWRGDQMEGNESEVKEDEHGRELPPR
ncbi:MAG: magnesium transporter [Propionibacterium sp.]|uniref:magnesium transporter MgtE N-terminal domain-containing protein n=1 Tax=Brooklawnia propionicigenes TaxID=3041175 RepID=UPI0016A30FBC|nr:CBS domain-containing protein [Brooklawnia sp. SH051]MEA5121300.1 PRC-barrel domain-containing protein [Propionibacterium sp.]NLI84386.1 magnesium transporter [Propionibacterium sp.]